MFSSDHFRKPKREALYDTKGMPEVIYPSCDPKLWEMMKRYMTFRNLDYALACRNDWYPTCSAQDTVPRVVIPARRSDEKIFWQARAMSIRSQVLRYQSPSIPKRDAVVVVYPYDTSYVFEYRGTVLTEGPMDALCAASCGFVGIAVMGSKPSPEALVYVLDWAFPHKPFIILADSNALSEAAGISGFLNSQKPGLCAKIVDPSPYTDLADAPPDTRNAILVEA